MVVLMVALVAFALGSWLRQWWLLALPPAAAAGAALLLAMPGTHVDTDNPLVFALVLMEILLAAGIVVGKRRPSRSNLPA